MFKKLKVLAQYLLPQFFLSRCFGALAAIQQVKIKNWMIHRFIRRYQIDMQEALLEQAEDYACFKLFFIRQLKAACRPIDASHAAIVSPADGSLAACGDIEEGQLLQAKNLYFSLDSLLAKHQALSTAFAGGTFATIYLAPHNYHRVHMPLAGKLLQTIYIPGKLFSVNRMTSSLIPNLYGRNERLICIFETADAGLMAVILVGALLVGSIHTVWQPKAIRAATMQNQDFSTQSPPIFLEKGAELGYFTMGSTVIVLFQADKIRWSPTLKSHTLLQMGEAIGYLHEKD
jgi:phosphatidylserine decarboxylase